MAVRGEAARRWGLCACLLGSTACASAELRGAAVLPPGEAPTGDVLAVFRFVGCADARGGAASWQARLVWIKTQTGRRALVQVRRDHDALVITNGFSERSERVYQLLHGDRLREIRLPALGGAGRFWAGRGRVLQERADGGFVAGFRQIDLSCRLKTEAPTDAGPAPQPSAAGVDPRLGY